MTKSCPGQVTRLCSPFLANCKLYIERLNNRATGPVRKGGITVRRKTFDLLVSTGGLVLAAVLLVAGGLLMWGYSFPGKDR